MILASSLRFLSSKSLSLSWLKGVLTHVRTGSTRGATGSEGGLNSSARIKLRGTGSARNSRGLVTATLGARSIGQHLQRRLEAACLLSVTSSANYCGESARQRIERLLYQIWFISSVLSLERIICKTITVEAHVYSLGVFWDSFSLAAGLILFSTIWGLPLLDSLLPADIVTSVAFS